MKYFLLACCVLLTACYHEPDTEWTPPIVQEQVECCITDQQVHGAIYSALLKLRWHIKDKKDNGFIATIRCDYDNIDMVFENTDREYFIAANADIDNVFEYEYCIKSHMRKVNKYIKKYLKKAVRKAARKELNGIR